MQHCRPHTRPLSSRWQPCGPWVHRTLQPRLSHSRDRVLRELVTASSSQAAKTWDSKRTQQELQSLLQKPS